MSELQSYVFLIKVNELAFTLLSKTLDKFQDSLLYRVTKGESCDFLLFDKNNINNIITADMDSNSLSFIINYMRGYPYYNIDEPLLSKIYYDADRLCIQTLVSKIKAQISEKNKLDDGKQIVRPQVMIEGAPIANTEQIDLNNFLRSLNRDDNSSGREDNYFTETSEPISNIFAGMNGMHSSENKNKNKNIDLGDNIFNRFTNFNRGLVTEGTSSIDPTFKCSSFHTTSSQEVKKNQRTVRPKKIYI